MESYLNADTVVLFGFFGVQNFTPSFPIHSSVPPNSIPTVVAGFFSIWDGPKFLVLATRPECFYPVIQFVFA